jgi:hypothetical protein
MNQFVYLGQPRWMCESRGSWRFCRRWFNAWLRTNKKDNFTETLPYTLLWLIILMIGNGLVLSPMDDNSLLYGSVSVKLSFLFVLNHALNHLLQNLQLPLDSHIQRGWPKYTNWFISYNPSQELFINVSYSKHV